MFAIPVAKLIAPENPWLPYLLVAIAGICMTGSAFFGIKAMTIVSYISVPLIAILGITAMVIAVKTGDVPLAEKFAENQGMSVIAGAGLVIGSFVSGGTATPNFARFSKTALQSVIVTVVAFFIGNSLMFCFGAFSGVYVGGNDIFEVMVALNLTVFAIIVLGLNIWTTNDNALYTAGLWTFQYHKGAETSDGCNFRYSGNCNRGMAVQQFRRLAEYLKLHTASGGHDCCTWLFLP